MRIGIDLDGVIVDSAPRWREVLRRETGAAYGPSDLPSTHTTVELAAISEAHELEMLIAPHPVSGAAAACARLRSDGHQLVVVTARAPRMRRLTEAWLAYHGIAVDVLHFLQGAAKGPVAHREGLALVVEDAPANALALAGAGIPVLLFSAPYNEQVRHPGVRRCEGWSSVLREIERMSPGNDGRGCGCGLVEP